MLLKAGTYRFNEHITHIEGLYAEIDFTSYNNQGGYVTDFKVIRIIHSISAGLLRSVYLNYFNGTNISITAYNFDLNDYSQGNWIAEEDRDFIIPYDQEVDDTFGTWYISNTNYNEVNPTEDTEYIEVASWYKGVANAIRSKKGTSEPILRDNFASEIESISVGADVPEYDGTVVIEKVKNLVFSNVAFTIGGQTQLWSETFGTDFATSYYKVATKPTENIESFDMENLTIGLYFVEDENDIFYHLEDGWVTLGGGLFSDMNISFKGVIGSTTEATEDGYYALMTEGVSV